MGNTIQNAVQQVNNSAPAEKKSVNQLMNTMLDGEGIRKRLTELLGERTPQFVSSLVSLVNGTPMLQKAFYESPMTIIQAGLKAATFDLPIDQNLGYAYIVPFTNSKKTDAGWIKKTEATFILGWKGMHQLALRTGVYKTINVMDVREGELKSYDRLTEDIDIEFIEDETERESKPVIGYVGYYRLINGASKTIYRTKKYIEAHEAKFRKGNDMGKGWKDDWDAMARKTIYRELIGKWGVMSITYQNNKDGQRLAEQMKQEMEDTSSAVYDTPYESVDEETGEVTENEVKSEQQGA